jgi:hypothetical protein
LCYLGIGIVIVVLGGAVIWHRDPVIRFFTVFGALATVLSLGVVNGHWSPWRLFTHAPLLNNVVPVNITAIIDTCVAIVLALVIERTRSATRNRWSRPGGVVAATAVTALALVPTGAALWSNIPLTVRAVAVPRWFTVAAPRLDDHAVVLPYPAALGGIQSSMAWQAVEGMTFSMVGGGGPGITPSRAGPEAAGFAVLSRASVPLSPPPPPSAGNLAAIRQALSGWGVTTVVVPDQPGLPTYERGRSVSYAVGLLTAALGQAPISQSEAWVWNDVSHAGPSVAMSASQFSVCTGNAVHNTPASAVAACVLRNR